MKAFPAPPRPLGARPARPAGTNRARLVALLAVAAFVCLAVLPASGGNAAPVDIAGPSITPTEPPPGSSTAAWYCAGSAGSVSGTVLVSAASGRQVRAVVHAANAGGRIGRQGLAVPPGTTASAPLAALVGPGPAAATVVVRGGAATVSLEGGDQAGAIPCTRSLSGQWYLAAGSTVGGADLLVSIYDPLPEDAVVDLGVTTPSGAETLPDYQGIVVHSGRERVIDLGTRVLNTPVLAVTAQAALGEVVVGGLAVAPRAASLVSVVPATASQWSVPVQVDGSGLETLDEIFNPGSAKVSVKVVLTSPKAPTISEVVLLPAGGVIQLTPGDSQSTEGGVLSSGWFGAEGGGRVVVESGLREVGSQGYRGAVVAGVPSGARTWVLGSVPLPKGSVAYVVVDGQGSQATTLSLGPVSGGTAREGKLRVLPGRPLVLNVSGDFASGLTLHSAGAVVLGAVTVVPKVGPSVLSPVRS